MVILCNIKSEKNKPCKKSEKNRKSGVPDVPETFGDLPGLPSTTSTGLPVHMERIGLMMVELQVHF